MLSSNGLPIGAKLSKQGVTNMAFRFNLNTVDYSHEPTTKLLSSLNVLRQYPCDYDAQDKAEDVWSILYNRRKSDPLQFAPVDELFHLADRGQLSDEDAASLVEGFLP